MFMRKCYILIVALIVLTISSIILTRLLSTTSSLYHLVQHAHILKYRYEAEQWVISEALFNASFESDDDIEETYGEYTYRISIKDEDVQIEVSGLESYEIQLKYSPECICFVEILYH